jgi:hypothetical protein
MIEILFSILLILLILCLSSVGYSFAISDKKKVNNKNKFLFDDFDDSKNPNLFNLPLEKNNEVIQIKQLPIILEKPVKIPTITFLPDIKKVLDPISVTPTVTPVVKSPEVRKDGSTKEVKPDGTIKIVEKDG